MAHEDELGILLQDVFDTWECSPNPGIIGYVSLLIEGYVEIDPHDYPLSGKLSIPNTLLVDHERDLLC
jgi:hypothetical protein